MTTDTAAAVRLTRTIPVPRDRAFQTFVDHMHHWWPETHSLLPSGRAALVVEPLAGGRWYERGASGAECDWGRVLVWDPPRRVVLSWQIGVGFEPQPDPQRASRVEVTFDAIADDQTTITLVHTDFEKHGEGWESMREGVARQGGWPGIVESYAERASRQEEPYGTFPDTDAVRFERLLPGPIERVWAYLTDPDLRARWLAGGPMELRVGGRVELHFKHSELSSEPDEVPEKYREMEAGTSFAGRVTACDPPRVLRYTWEEGRDDESEVTFELRPEGEHVRLVLVHRRLGSREAMVSVASGWHTHLAILADRLAAREARAFWRAHTRFEAGYEDLLA